MTVIVWRKEKNKYAPALRFALREILPLVLVVWRVAPKNAKISHHVFVATEAFSEGQTLHPLALDNE